MKINTKRPVLSISLLASNRPDVIRRCLDSIVPVMEQLPCELILVDTSQNPEIHLILQEYSKNIVEFTWCNDFAKARNAGLKRATGEWFLFIDDDEWFDDVTELVGFFKSGEYLKYGCANYMVRNFYDLNYTNYVDCWASRMIRLEKDTEFRSKIHEYLCPVNGDCKALPVVVNHSGYVYATKEEQQKHYERNVNLLIQMAKEEPEVLRWKVQLVQEYHSVKNWNKIYEFCMECLAENKDTNSLQDNFDIGTFYSGAIEALNFLKRYKEAVELGNEALKDERNSELCQANMYLFQAVAYYRMNDMNHAKKCIWHYLELLEVLRQMPNKWNNQRMALLVCETFEPIPMKRAKSVLICSGLRQNNLEYLHQYFNDLEWESKSMYLFEGIVDELILAAARVSKDAVLVKALRLLWEHEELQTDMFAKFVRMNETNPEGYKKILAVASDFEGSHWYPWYARILTADRIKDIELLHSGLEGFFHRTTNIFLTPQEIIEVIQRHVVSLEHYYLQIPFEQWAEHLNQYITKAGIQDARVLARELREMKTCENIRYDYFEMRLAEAEVLYVANITDKIEDLLYTYAKVTVTFEMKYYQKEVFEDYLDLLPNYVQAAWLLWQVFTTDKKEIKEIHELLAEAESIYPEMGQAIYYYRSNYQKIQINKMLQLQRMKSVMKTQRINLVRKFIQQHNCADAQEELEQLKQEYPHNLELVELSLELTIATL